MAEKEAEKKKNIADFFAGLPKKDSNFILNYEPSKNPAPLKILYRDIKVDNSKSVPILFGLTHPFLKEVENERQRIKQHEREIEREAQLFNFRKKRERAEEANGKKIKKRKEN